MSRASRRNDNYDLMLLRGFKVVSISLFVTTLLMFLASTVKLLPFEIMISYVPQYLIIMVGAFMILFALFARFMIRDGWHGFSNLVSSLYLAIVFATVSMCFYVYIQSFAAFSPARLIIDNLPAFNVATYNVNYRNEDIEDAVAFIHSKQTDVLVLQEVTPAQAEEFRQNLNLTYSFVSDCSCSADGTEIALLSRYPLSNMFMALEDKHSAIIHAQVQLSQTQDFVVYGVHVAPPFSNSMYNGRNDSIDKLQAFIEREDLPVIVMGDFNTTPFSPVLKDFIINSQSHIRNTEQRRWPKCSWYGATSFACARLDHIFIPVGWAVRDEGSGDRFGSDHKVVVARVIPI